MQSKYYIKLHNYRLLKTMVFPDSGENHFVKRENTQLHPVLLNAAFCNALYHILSCDIAWMECALSETAEGV